MCYTSGTTGRPKGVVYSHRSTILHTLVASLGDFWGLRGTDVVMPVTPMFHANSWGMPYGAVMMGVKLVFPGPHLHPDDLLDLMHPGATHPVAGRAHHLDEPDPGLSTPRRTRPRPTTAAGSCRPACARWSAVRRCPSR